MLRLPVTTRRVPCTRVVLAVLASSVALTLGACSSTSPRYQQQAWRLDGAPIGAAYEPRDMVPQEMAEPAPEATPADWPAERKYEYRGGRDPNTGRARIQM